jgi:hypothetical protein
MVRSLCECGYDRRTRQARKVGDHHHISCPMFRLADGRTPEEDP